MCLSFVSIMSHVWFFEFSVVSLSFWFSFVSFVVTVILETSNFQPISLEFDPVTPFVSSNLYFSYNKKLSIPYHGRRSFHRFGLYIM